MPSWKKVIISGSDAALSSLNVTGAITGSSVLITGSTGTLFSSNVDTLILTGSMIVTGSSVITGSLNVTQGITGSLFGTASWAVSASTAQTASFVTASNVYGPYGSSSILSSSFAVSSSRAVTSSYAISASYAPDTTFPYTGSALITGSLGITGSLSVTNGITGSLFGTSSWAQSASIAFATPNAFTLGNSPFIGYVPYANGNLTLSNTSIYYTGGNLGVNTTTPSASLHINGSALITGSLTVGTGSLGSSENTLTLGPSPAGGTGEGGQLGLNASGGLYTSASMIDNWQNQTRLLRGTSAGSDAVVAAWNMHTKQMTLPQYTSPTSFTGTTLVGLLGFDSSGNLLTTTTGSSGGGGSVTINNNTDNYIVTATGTANTLNGESSLQFNGTSLTVTGQVTASGAIISLANGAMYFRGGDDAEFWDINVANTVGIYGQQTQAVGGLKLGSSGATLFGSASNFGIGTITPNSGALHVNGGVFATSFTGSHFGTSSWASNALTASFIVSSSYALSSSFASTASYVLQSVSSSFASTASFVATAQTASFVTTAQTASFVTGSNVYGPFGSNSILSASFAVSSSRSDLTTAVYTPGGTANQFLYQSAGGAGSATTSTSNITYDSANTSLNATNVGISSAGTFSSTLDRSNNISMHDGTFGIIKIRNNNVDKIVINRNSLGGLIQLSGSTTITGSLDVNGGITGSLFGTSSWAVSASWAPTAVSASNSLTASYVLPLRQDVLITGSLNVTGSTVQIGNNTLAGNTTLSGSIIISGSTTTPATPTIKVYGDMETNGVIKFMPVVKTIDNSISASYIYVSGSTNDLYFSQNGSGYSNSTRLRWMEGNLYTGLLSGGVISSTIGSTTFNVSSGSGIIVTLNAFTASQDPFPTIQYVKWPTYTAQAITNSGSAKITYLSMKNDGTINQQTVPIGSTDVTQWDTQIELGVVLHLSGSVSTGVYNSPQLGYGFAQRTDDFVRAFGPVKISGHTLQASGSTLSIIKTAGTAYNNGANYVNNPNHPSTVSDPAVNVSKIYRYYVSGSTPIIDTGVANAGYTVIDPSKYVDNTGALASVPGGSYSIQRVFWIPNSPTNAFLVYYGNAKYNSSTDAATAIQSEVFTEAPNTAQNAILVGYIIVAGGESNLQNANIIQGGLFRAVNGIGNSNTSPLSTTFASLSDVSVAGRTNGDLPIYNGSQWANGKILTGVYGITGSLNVSQGVTGSLFGTATSASYALTSSNVQGGTANYITLWNTATSLSSSAIYQSAGKIGIGTTAATSPLFITTTANPSTPYVIIEGYAAGGYPMLRFNQTNGSGNAPFIEGYHTNGGTLTFRVKDTGDGYFSGSVGIGTTTPSAKLDVNGGAVVTGSFTIINTTPILRLINSASGAVGSNQIIPRDETYSSKTAGATTFAITPNDSGGTTIGGIVYSKASNTATNTAFNYNSSATTAIYISGSGNVGIGTTTPNYKLDVSGSANITGSLNVGISTVTAASIASSAAGANAVFTQSTGSFTAAKYLYTVTSASNARTGEVMAVWNGTSVQYTDNSTLDIGSTTAVTASVSIVTSQAQFNMQTTNAGWTIKSQVTYL